jgi:hypothetical protein
MAEGRSKERWNHTAAILALQANCHRDPKKRKKAFTPADFLPRDERSKERTKDLSILKAVFVDHPPPKEQ